MGKRARSEDDSGEEDDVEQEREEAPRKKARKASGGDEEAMDETEKSLLNVPAPTPKAAVSDERYKHFMGMLNKFHGEEPGPGPRDARHQGLLQEGREEEAIHRQ